MKKYIKPTIVFLVVLVIAAYFVIINKSPEWKTYTNTDPSFSFNYPDSWGEPRVFQDKEKNQFKIDFQNYSFSVSNGYYIIDENGNTPTVPQFIENYKKDMDSKNEIKSFQTENIKVDNYMAVKVTYLTFDGTDTQYVDIYIVPDQNKQDKFILIKTNKNFSDDKTLDKLLSTFKVNP